MSNTLYEEIYYRNFHLNKSGGKLRIQASPQNGYTIAAEDNPAWKERERYILSDKTAMLFFGKTVYSHYWGDESVNNITIKERILYNRIYYNPIVSLDYDQTKYLKNKIEEKESFIYRIKFAINKFFWWK